MRSGSNSFNYFPQNKLTNFANLVQFKRMLMFCLEHWGAWGPFVHATGLEMGFSE